MIEGRHFFCKTGIIIFLCYLIIMNCSCASSYASQIINFKDENIEVSDFRFDSSIWRLDSLWPSEKAILFKRQITPISVYMEAHGDCYYILQLSANGKKFNPFIIRMSRGGGAIDFSGHITWYIKVKSRAENIIISLYRIEETDLCKTQVITLIKQFRRRYNVIKHKKSLRNINRKFKSQIIEITR